MLGYITLGVSDVAKARAFYEPILGALGMTRNAAFSSDDHLTFYEQAKGRGAMLAIGKPYDKNPATFGNGTMVALAAADRATVDKVHAQALAAGAQDEGAPGVRGAPFYGAYFRDHDGNKFCVFNMTGA